MMMTNLIVVYDACVLYSAPLRDLLMYLALTDLYHAKWTDRIHDEWIGNLLLNRLDLHRTQLERTRALMNENVRDCLVEDYEDLVLALELPDQNDRHVLAAAIKSSASIIVTYNQKDFPVDYIADFGVETLHPDTFISRLIHNSPGVVCSSVKKLRGNLKRPKKSSTDYINIIEKQSLPQTAAMLREFEDLI